MEYDDMVREGARHFHSRFGCGTRSLRNTVLRYLLKCFRVCILVLAPVAMFVGLGGPAVLLFSALGIGDHSAVFLEDSLSLSLQAAIGCLLFYGSMKILGPVEREIEKLQTERDRGGDITKYKREGDLYYYSAADYCEAAKWYRRAANLGDGDAQLSLGIMYYKGRGVVRDYAEAAKWFRQAADRGDNYAQNNLGVMYAKGQGVTQDDAEAVKWFRKAADQGHAAAQHSLGARYYEGQSVTQDYAEAAKWCRKAADQGNATAQNDLGFSYEHGHGVTQDYVQALKWFSLASSLETDTEKRAIAVKNCDIMAAKMNTAQIADAQRLAREWKPMTGTATKRRLGDNPEPMPR